MSDTLFDAKLKRINHNYYYIHPTTVSKVLEHYLDTVDLEKYVPQYSDVEKLKEEIRIFYQINNYQLTWSNGKKLNKDAKNVIEAIEKAHLDGLDSRIYRPDFLVNRSNEVFNENKFTNIFNLIDLDLHFTGTLIGYGWHLENGRIDPGEKDWRWAFDKPVNPVAAKLSVSLMRNNLKEQLEELAPRQEQYKKLKNALKTLYNQQQSVPVETLPRDFTLRPGNSDPLVPLVRKRLIASGDMKSLWKNNLKDQHYDILLEESIKAFQIRHGLVADGIIGKETVAMLNLSAAEKINIVNINLERLRWMPVIHEKDYLLINLPEYFLKVYENDKEALKMKIIIGKSLRHATPIFHDQIEYLVFSPTWGVPDKIVRNEILPTVRKDPGYLQRNGYRVYSRNTSEPINPQNIDWSNEDLDLRVVQQPGPANALGLVKFIMPNRYNIYLHDTPADYLFNRNERDFSHGCIRVERPEDLALHLLKGSDGWDKSKIREYMHKGYASTIWLDKPLPVYMMYQTAFVDDNGVLNFRKDIYHHDTKQSDLIAVKNSSQ